MTYSITEGPRYLFDIDATSGLVFTTAQLDREAEENSDGTFILEITVKEVSKINPPPSVSTEVTVILTDVNDETPTFRSSLYRAEINENALQNTPVNFIDDAVPEVFDHDLVSQKFGFTDREADLASSSKVYCLNKILFPRNLIILENTSPTSLVNFPGYQWHVSNISRRRRWNIRRNAIPRD